MQSLNKCSIYQHPLRSILFLVRLATYYILAQMNTIISHPFVEHLMLSNPNDGIYIEETSANKYFIKAIYIFTLKWQENVLLVDA